MCVYEDKNVWMNNKCVSVIVSERVVTVKKNEKSYNVKRMEITTKTPSPNNIH